MKYIRTKDGIRYIMSFKSEEHEIETCNKLGCRYADTIEELCDEFVHGKMVFKILNECLDYAPNGGDIYAAIWTDKGLIYVAKMNEKGELELL